MERPGNIIITEPGVIDLSKLTGDETVKFTAYTGNRSLDVTLYGGELPMADTVIRTEPTNPFRIWREGAITDLYQFTADKIREAVELLDHWMLFKLPTEHPKMRVWALAPEKGYKVFDWDGVQTFWRDEEKTNLWYFNAWKKFFPKRVTGVVVPKESWGLLQTKEEAEVFNKWFFSE